MKVTGPKTDTWLVKTVAVLLVAIATIFLLASRVKRTLAGHYPEYYLFHGIAGD